MWKCLLCEQNQKNSPEYPFLPAPSYVSHWDWSDNVNINTLKMNEMFLVLRESLFREMMSGCFKIDLWQSCGPKLWRMRGLQVSCWCPVSWRPPAGVGGRRMCAALVSPLNSRLPCSFTQNTHKKSVTLGKAKLLEQVIRVKEEVRI